MQGLEFKGQMLYCHESDCLLFLASPLVDGLEALTSRGLFISDIPIHDATRDIVLIGEQARAQVRSFPFSFISLFFFCFLSFFIVPTSYSLDTGLRRLSVHAVANASYSIFFSALVFFFLRFPMKRALLKEQIENLIYTTQSCGTRRQHIVEFLFENDVDVRLNPVTGLGEKRGGWGWNMLIHE